MKKIMSLASIMALTVLVGCEQQTDEDTSGNTENTAAEDTSGDQDGPINVVASTTHVTDLVDIIGGEHVEVEGLMGPGVDPHDYEPTASDVEAMTNADIVGYNGLHLEAMFVDVFEQLETQGATTIAMEDAISEDYYLDSEEDDLEHDPHIWFSVSLWQDATQYVADELSTYDPENEETYQANADDHVEDLDELDEYIRTRIEEVPEESRYLITAHDAFQYFGEEYDFEVIGIQGLNPQTEAGTADISQIADFIAEQDINAVFVETSVSSRNVEALIEAVEARDHEIELGGELYSDALGSEEDGTDTYIGMYEHNIDTIVEALN